MKMTTPSDGTLFYSANEYVGKQADWNEHGFFYSAPLPLSTFVNRTGGDTSTSNGTVTNRVEEVRFNIQVPPAAQGQAGYVTFDSLSSSALGWYQFPFTKDGYRELAVEGDSPGTKYVYPQFFFHSSAVVVGSDSGCIEANWASAWKERRAFGDTTPLGWVTDRPLQGDPQGSGHNDWVYNTVRTTNATCVPRKFFMTFEGPELQVDVRLWDDRLGRFCALNTLYIPGADGVPPQVLRDFGALSLQGRVGFPSSFAATRSVPLAERHLTLAPKRGRTGE